MSAGDFESWLAQELQVLNADEEVFKPYILSILEEEDDDEAMAEALHGVVESMMEDAGEAAIKKFRNAILDKWKEHKLGGVGASTAADTDGCEVKLSSMDLGAKLASITESQTAAYNANRASAAANAALLGPDKSVKEAILAQYAGAVEESDDDEDGEEGGDGGDDLGRNVNAEAVARAEQEKREKSRAAAAAKKDKDKEDREKQKKEAEDRKKKAQEKAAKGERRR